ncbi:peptidase inhibitor family I36 protein [Streptomyces sulfonofaciens]|nr:peptidase inhibitor family I36 protein [Streptomyces sulfonofaciens]
MAVVIGIVALAITAVFTSPFGAVAEAGAVAAPVVAPAPDSGATALAWECPAGDFCVWENPGGVGRRCNWSVADPDWQGGSISCSWSSTVKVESAKDNGNDPAFAAVAVYRQANEEGRFACLDRGKNYEITAGGVLLRSHEWVTYHC